MQKLVWQNAKGEELDLTGGNYGITEWEGFSNTSLNIQSQQVPFQDGGVFLDALIEQRELTVTLAIQDNNNLSLRYQQRRELISALNPKLGEGYLIYTNDYISKRIKCIPQIPIFETHNSDTVGTPKASLSWTACSPYWEDLEETVVEIDTEPTLIQNEGDVPVGFEIEVLPSENKEILLLDTETTDFIGIADNPLDYAFKISTLAGNKVVESLSNPMTELAYEITNDYIKSIAYSPKLEMWIGTGLEGIYKSTDKENWVVVYSFGSQYQSKVIWNDVIEKFIVIADRNVLSSADIITWNSTTIDLGILDLCFNENTGTTYFVGTSENPKVYTTDDGITITPNAEIEARCCCYNYVTGEVLIANDNEHCYILKNGNWELQPALPEGFTENTFDFCFIGTDGRYCLGQFWYGLVIVTPSFTVVSVQGIYGGYDGCYNKYDGKYYIGGQIPFSSEYFLWVSENGINWEKDSYTITTQINQMYITQGEFNAVSPSNIIYEIRYLPTNMINKIIKGSNMNKQLKVGDNYLFKSFSVGSDITMTLKYRKKYIGV